MQPECDLCTGVGGRHIWGGEDMRVVAVDEAEYPGFMRVIWHRHVRELTDLAPAERDRLMRVVFLVEDRIRHHLSPHKMNVASLGNVTPHVHWHLIPRFASDPHFPGPIWAAPQRAADRSRIDQTRSLLLALEQDLAAALAALPAAG